MIPLSGATIWRDPDAAPIEVTYGTVSAWQERVAWGPYRVSSADLFDIEIPGVARFTCRDRRQVLVSPAAGAGEQDIAPLLIATVLPALLWSRGEIVLHGAASVRPSARAGSILAGASGSGKSSLLGRALQRGALGIADDSVRLRLADGLVLASGLPGGRWVRRGKGQDDREFVPTPASQRCSERPVSRLTVIEPDCRHRQTLRGVEALAALLRHRHRPRIAAVLGTEKDLIAKLWTVAAALRVVAVPPCRLDALGGTDV